MNGQMISEQSPDSPFHTQVRLEPPSLRDFYKRLGVLVLFGVPAIYLGNILNVFIHEVVGHGLTAVVLGGEFRGFVIHHDGMGWALAFSQHERLVWATGPLSGLILGLLCMTVALRSGVSIHLRLLFFIAGGIALVNECSYLFFNAVFPRPPGDIGRILLSFDSASLRWALILVTGVGFVSCMIILNVLVLRFIEEVAGPLSRIRALLVACVVLGVIGAGVQFAFDWNQLIVDVGRLPQLVSAGMQVAVIPIALRFRRYTRRHGPEPLRDWLPSIRLVWIAAGLVALVTEFLLSKGIIW